MTKKQALRCIAFILAVCVMMVVLCDLFEQENGNWADRCFNTYRASNPDTIDAVFLGTSGVACYWVAPLAYEEFGMTVYPLAADAMPAWLYTKMLDEVLTYQNPELILLDIRPFTSEPVDADTMDARARCILDAMDLFSINRNKTAVKAMKTIHAAHPDAPQFDISYFLSFVKYHPKWVDGGHLLSYNLGQRMHKYGGYRLDQDFIAVVSPQTPTDYDPNLVSDLTPLYEEALYEVMDYIRDKDLNVLFVDTPKVAGSKMGASNRVYQILEEEGFDCLTYLAPPEDGAFPLDLDYSTDFYNSGHVNYYGAAKFTRALAAYLDTHYDLPDRRNDPAVQAQWDGLYEVMLEDLKEIEAETATRGVDASAGQLLAED